MVALVFAFILAHYPSKPKHPPSITSTMQRTAFLPSLISICTNPQVLNILMYFGQNRDYTRLESSSCLLHEFSGPTDDLQFCLLQWSHCLLVLRNEYNLSSLTIGGRRICGKIL